MVDYLASIQSGAVPSGNARASSQLLGQDSDWENPAAMMAPMSPIGPVATSRSAGTQEIEDLIAELQTRRPELVAKSDEAAIGGHGMQRSHGNC